MIRALQKNRGDRFQDAAAFRRALRAAKSGVQLSPLPASEAPTDPDGFAPTQEPLAKAGLSHAALDATVLSPEGVRRRTGHPCDGQGPLPAVR